MNPLFRKIAASPGMWIPAAGLGFAKLLGRPTGTVSRHGFKITCGTGAGQGSYCAVAGLAYEPELRWVVDRLHSGDTFVDIGANIGVYTLHAARKVGPSGSVIAVEPSRDAAEILRRNVTQNRFSEQVRIVQAAASHTAGRLYLSGDTSRWNALQLSADPPGQDVQVVTVDEVLDQASQRGPVSLLKMDAEGVEYDVLRGASGTISKHRPAIVFESTFQRTDDSAAAWLVDQNYKVLRIDPLSGLLSDVQSSDSARTVNLIAIPR